MGRLFSRENGLGLAVLLARECQYLLIRSKRYLSWAAMRGRQAQMMAAPSPALDRIRKATVLSVEMVRR